MWTFRLRLHMKGGQQEDLFGTEMALVALRQELRRVKDSGRDAAVPYESSSGATVIDVGRLERIGDLEPVIPSGFKFGPRLRRS